MKHFLLVIFAILITDFYYFPIEFAFLPGVNTKMALAGIGLVVLGFNLAKHRTGQIDKGFLWLSLAALCVSFISYVSIVINNTPDHSFTGYIVSMWVWLGGAYTVIGNDAQVGNFNMIQSYAVIGHDAKVGDWNRIDTHVTCVGGVVIENHVNIHTSAVISHNVVVESEVNVGACSFVIRKVKSGTTVLGNPAKRLL